MLGLQSPGEVGGLPGEPRLARRAGGNGTERVEDDRDVDALLEQGAGGGRQRAGRRDAHRGEGQRHPGERALPRDAAGARRAIPIASVSRSSRFTVRTTSAASLAAVAPRAHMATPTSATASA